MLVALDTNFVIYAEGHDDLQKSLAAKQIVNQLFETDIIIPVQVFGEVFSVLTLKKRLDRHSAMARLDEWSNMVAIASTTAAALKRAIQLAADHKVQIWDAIILATCEEAGCEILLSEDMQHGFQWRRITVISPFAQPHHPLLAAAISQRT